MIRKRDSKSLCQARKTRSKAFRKRGYFSCSYIEYFILIKNLIKKLKYALLNTLNKDKFYFAEIHKI